MTSQTDMRRTAPRVRQVFNGAAAVASAKGCIRRRTARIRVWSGVVAAVVAFGVPAAAQAQTVTIHATSGQQFTSVLGYYTEACIWSELECPAPVGGTATINWGDGTPPDMNATIAYAGGWRCSNAQRYCVFQVSGSHTYIGKGTYAASFVWTNDSFEPARAGTVAFSASVN